MAGELLALVSRQTHFSPISRILKQIEIKYTENLNVEQLAAESNMSVSAFRHNFKAVNSTSQLQYLKSYRVHKARMMIIHDGMKVSSTAMRGSYESASQFRWEFKRYFGVTSGEDAAKECGQCKGAKLVIPARVCEAQLGHPGWSWVSQALQYFFLITTIRVPSNPATSSATGRIIKNVITWCS